MAPRTKGDSDVNWASVMPKRRAAHCAKALDESSAAERFWRNASLAFLNGGASG